MKTGLSKVLIVMGVCLGALLFTNCLMAQDVEDTVQGLINEGVPPEVIDDVISGPADTLGQRVEGMLEAGTITQKQYDALTRYFLSLPDEKRWAIKNAYDKGYAEKVYNQVMGGIHERLNDDGSLRDHVKDLRQQGYTREQIKNRLNAEGVASARVDAIVAEEASRREHARDLRKEGLSREQAKERAREMIEPGHAKDKRDEIKGVDRRGHARDIEHERERAREHSKDVRDVRRSEDVRERRDRERRGR